MSRFVQKSIDEATPAELRAFAGDFLGVPVEGLADRAVLAKIRAAHEGDMIFVTETPSEQTQVGSPPPAVEDKASDVANTGRTAGGLGRSDPKVTLTLHAEERDGVVYSRHKEVGVNGKVWLLKRGTSITIPYRVFEALNNAERSAVTHGPDGEVRRQVVKNTPFNIEHMPPAEEIEAWRERVAAEFVPE